MPDVVSLTLQSALDGLAMRQQVAANNIANVDTPGYHAQSVDFESALTQALGAGDDNTVAQDIAGATPSVSTSDAPVGANGNNVDLATETMTATQSLYQYQLVSRAVDDHYGLLRASIGGM
ncbi:MAG: flagellar basal body rod protein FlgB [Nocardioidaceae bacterium]